MNPDDMYKQSNLEHETIIWSFQPVESYVIEYLNQDTTKRNTHKQMICKAIEIPTHELFE